MSIIKKRKVSIQSIVNCFDNIYTIVFNEVNPPLKFHPGQFLHLALDFQYDGTSQWPDSRCFSIQSSPDERNIKITFAVKGQFTSEMKKSLRPGSEIWIKLPYGDLFTRPHNLNDTVFIAGGTGLTPFISLFTHRSFSNYKNPRLYLGFRSKKHNIFSEELSKVGNLITEIVYEDVDGILDIHRIFLLNGIKSTYFISGPPSMIKEFKLKLIGFGVPSAQILTDDWE